MEEIASKPDGQGPASEGYVAVRLRRVCQAHRVNRGRRVDHESHRVTRGSLLKIAETPRRIMRRRLEAARRVGSAKLSRRGGAG